MKNMVRVHFKDGKVESHYNVEESEVAEFVTRLVLDSGAVFTYFNDSLEKISYFPLDDS